MVKPSMLLIPAAILLLLCVGAFAQDQAQADGSNDASEITPNPTSTTTPDIVDIEFLEDETEMWMSGSDGLELEHEVIDVQADQAISGERFVAVHAPKPMGAAEALRPDLVALANMAIAFLPPNYRFLSVDSASREILNGVRYALVANTLAPDGETVLQCELIVLERPWLLVGEFDKQRELLRSNCTDPSAPSVDDSHVNDANNFNFNPVFVNQGNGAMDAAVLRDLEAQIVPAKPRATKKPTGMAAKPTPTSKADADKGTAFDEALRLLEADILQAPAPATAAALPVGVDVVDCEHLVEPRLEAAASTEATPEATSEATTETMNDFQRSFLDEFFAVHSTESATVVAASETTTEMALPVIEEVAVISTTTEDASSTAAEIVPTSTEIAAEEADIDSGSSSTASSSSSTTTETIGSVDTVDAAASVVANTIVNERVRRQTLVGGASDLPAPQAQQYAEAALERLSAELSTGDSPPASLKLVNVVRASQQVVAGLKYVLDVVAINESERSLQQQEQPQIECHITIWSRAWLKDGTQVTTKCGELEKKFSMELPEVADSPSQSALTATDGPLELDPRFTQFTIDFNRVYANNTERRRRQKIFLRNLRKVSMLQKHERGSAEYGVTQFSDMTADEFARWTGLTRTTRGELRSENEVGNAAAIIPEAAAPFAFDWRDKGVVTPVKNQGSCGSCWAFSVTGNIESLHAIKTGQLEQYSEQELVDCDTVDSGCNGGLPDNAYKAIEKLGGLELEQDYPYSAKDGKCRFDQQKTHVRVSGAVDLPQNETAMAQYLVANGPLSIGLNANAMQFYRAGVSHPPHMLCSRDKLDHGVLIVGLGEADYPLFNKKLPFWIVKNSWGPNWGEQGYYRVFRGDNTCGVSMMVSSAVLAD